MEIKISELMNKMLESLRYHTLTSPYQGSEGPRLETLGYGESLHASSPAR